MSLLILIHQITQNPITHKKMNHTKLKVTGLLALIISIGTATSGHAQTLLESLQASNYNATTGVWTNNAIAAPGGSNADGTGNGGIAIPTLATGATANGSSAVAFNGSQELTFDTPVPTEISYTIFAYVLPTNGSHYGAIVSGADGSLEYRTDSGNTQTVNAAEQSNVGTSSGATLSNSSFNLIDVTTGASGTAFRLNGAADGASSTAANFHSLPITTIGSQPRLDSGERFIGDIADIEIYSGILTAAQIQTEEAVLTAEYATTAAVPEPSTWALLLGGLGSLVVLGRFRKSSQV
jgi:hypothetical protein